ncbi:hypothetical protein WI23_08785 [Burkholderia oklahomensis C6786]|nr:hypothetical protein WI23_08785 [Burkholderia oklahomensis C6786]KUY51320.1 hypothetical protein WI23_26660 [Burkholderia oklahomensis C6786]
MLKHVLGTSGDAVEGGSADAAESSGTGLGRGAAAISRDVAAMSRAAMSRRLAGGAPLSRSVAIRIGVRAGRLRPSGDQL